MAASSKAQRVWLAPKTSRSPRAPGEVVAKDVVPRVQTILPLGDRVVVSHHEGLSSSPGGLTVRDAKTFAVLRTTKGSFGPVVPFGDAWLTSGPLWRGCFASTHVVDPRTLKVLARFPVAGPLLPLDAHRFVASTPPRELELIDGGGMEPGAFKADPKLLRASWVKLPMPGGVVEVDVRRKTTKLLVPANRFEGFAYGVASPDRTVVYVATDFGRTVAVRVADGKVLWERPAKDNVLHWSGRALALDPSGRFLATAGSSATSFDLFVLDTRTGKPEAQMRLLDMVNRAKVSPTKSNRVEALAFHPSGVLVAVTNGGVVVELHASGAIAAFRAATRGIDALAFLETDEGSAIVVGGAEPNLRVWPWDDAHAASDARAARGATAKVGKVAKGTRSDGGAKLGARAKGAKPARSAAKNAKSEVAKRVTMTVRDDPKAKKRTRTITLR